MASLVEYSGLVDVKCLTELRSLPETLVVRLDWLLKVNGPPFSWWDQGEPALTPSFVSVMAPLFLSYLAPSSRGAPSLAHLPLFFRGVCAWLVKRRFIINVISEEIIAPIIVTIVGISLIDKRFFRIGC
jgi:hypothetical protein